MFKELLTDTSAHNPERFIYLVHGMRLPGPCSSQSVTASAVARLRSPAEFFSASLVGRLDAQIAKEKLGYYGTVFQTDTCGIAGLIVEHHTDNDIWIAWNCDLISHKSSPSGRRQFASEHRGKVRSPLTLLTGVDGPPGTYWNELVLQGNPQLRIAGVFYRAEIGFPLTTARGYGEFLAKAISGLEDKEVPLIELPTSPAMTEPKFELKGSTSLSGAFEEFYAPRPVSLESLVP